MRARSLAEWVPPGAQLTNKASRFIGPFSLRALRDQLGFAILARPPVRPSARPPRTYSDPVRGARCSVRACLSVTTRLSYADGTRVYRGLKTPLSKPTIA
jgi:hypothetical protein